MGDTGWRGDSPMRLLLILLCLTTSGGWLAGCGQKSAVTVLSSPYADGIEHAEPVFFTGKHYLLKFKYDSSRSSYAVRLSGTDTTLAATDGDRRLVTQIVSASLSHFACPTKWRAVVDAASMQHGDAVWSMDARCTGETG
jgi:hypothetical protein